MGATLASSNLMLLLEERSEDIPSLKKWLQRRNTWLDSRIQNELIELMAKMSKTG